MSEICTPVALPESGSLIVSLPPLSDLCQKPGVNFRSPRFGDSRWGQVALGSELHAMWMDVLVVPRNIAGWTAYEIDTFGYSESSYINIRRSLR